jgi:hypothetical protein
VWLVGFKINFCWKGFVFRWVEPEWWWEDKVGCFVRENLSKKPGRDWVEIKRVENEKEVCDGCAKIIGK